MPPRMPPDKLEADVRTWARETLPEHDWLMARHDDTDHPHVHVTVRAVGRSGLRLAPGPFDLQQWRERFARELRRLGVEAEATPRQARGQVRKSSGIAVTKIGQRGLEPRVQAAAKQAPPDYRRCAIRAGTFKPGKTPSARRIWRTLRMVLYGRLPESKLLACEVSKGLQSYMRPVCAGVWSCWP